MPPADDAPHDPVQQDGAPGLPPQDLDDPQAEPDDDPSGVEFDEILTREERTSAVILDPAPDDAPAAHGSRMMARRSRHRPGARRRGNRIGLSVEQNPADQTAPEVAGDEQQPLEDDQGGTDELPPTRGPRTKQGPATTTRDRPTIVPRPISRPTRRSSKPPPSRLSMTRRTGTEARRERTTPTMRSPAIRMTRTPAKRRPPPMGRTPRTKIQSMSIRTTGARMTRTGPPTAMTTTGRTMKTTMSPPG